MFYKPKGLLVLYKLAVTGGELQTASHRKITRAAHRKSLVFTGGFISASTSVPLDKKKSLSPVSKHTTNTIISFYLTCVSLYVIWLYRYNAAIKTHIVVHLVFDGTEIQENQKQACLNDQAFTKQHDFRMETERVVPILK